MFLGVWGGQLDVELPDILVVEYEQLEELQLYLDSGDLKAPSKLFYIVPAACSYIVPVCFAIKYLHSPTAEVVGGDTRFDRFFDLWKKLVSEPGRAVPYADQDAVCLPEELLEFHPPVLEAFELALEFVANCRKELVSCGAVFGTYSGDIPFPTWRDQSISGLKKLNSLCARVECKAEGNPIFSAFLKGLTEARDEFSRLQATDLSGSLSRLSSYTLALAQESLDRGDLIGSISLSHRSIDYFLQSLCVDHGLLSETNEGIVFPHDKSRKVGMMACYKVLVASGIIVRSKRTNDQLHRCNNIRNYLISTHSVFGTSTDHAKKYNRTVCDLMERIDPSKHRIVKKSFRVLRLENILPQSLLFADSGDISTSFVEVPEIKSKA